MRRSLCAAAVVLAGAAAAAPPPTRQEAADALRRAVAFYRTRAAVQGGYVWRYSSDLAAREGEAVTDGSTVWVQPPGTPTVGEAYLDAHEATREPAYLDAAREAALCLLRGQLQSGGWDYGIYFDPARRGEWAYRADGRRKARSFRTVLDDDTTQSALRFLARVDRALDFKAAAIHEGARYGLDALVSHQFPVGGWPANFPRYPDPQTYPVLQASYPETWSRTWTKDFTGCYVLNDNTTADVIRTLLDAAEVYGEARYADAARRGGEFLLRAQMPDPQPAWAQQYDRNMQPVWSRKFEPPAISTRESLGALRSLLRVYQKTGDRKFLEPFPRALAYLRKSALPDGKHARFLELRTNRPLYFTRDYQLTYSAADVPRHYSFVAELDLDAVEAEYRAAADGRPPAAKPGGGEAAARAADAIRALDSRGAWVEKGRLKGVPDHAPGVIQSETFARNVRALCDFLRE